MSSGSRPEAHQASDRRGRRDDQKVSVGKSEDEDTRWIQEKVCKENLVPESVWNSDCRIYTVGRGGSDSLELSQQEDDTVRSPRSPDHSATFFPRHGSWTEQVPQRKFSLTADKESLEFSLASGLLLVDAMKGKVISSLRDRLRRKDSPPPKKGKEPMAREVTWPTDFTDDLLERSFWTVLPEERSRELKGSRGKITRDFKSSSGRGQRRARARFSGGTR
ncbi:hypothetical protein AVEN_125308-1 [Araneus ventricosus]|uniref:Uncharacterized protein n=1 Tax=Araneus ventricosus TaxID=182803 RepID=A0A4Y2Q7N2_ARAVE|nr:hypothetical protein AVEN_125308-1 [Araneus ventricosus]